MVSTLDRLRTWLLQPYFPGLVVVGLLLVLTVVSKYDSAITIGFGLGSVASPIFAVLTLIVGLAAKRSWHVLVFCILASIVHRLVAVTPLEPRSVAYDTYIIASGALISMVAASIVSATKLAIVRGKRSV